MTPPKERTALGPDARSSSTERQSSREFRIRVARLVTIGRARDPLLRREHRSEKQHRGQLGEETGGRRRFSWPPHSAGDRGNREKKKVRRVHVERRSKQATECNVECEIGDACQIAKLEQEPECDAPAGDPSSAASSQAARGHACQAKAAFAG
jgi:hypothetical protein